MAEESRHDDHGHAHAHGPAEGQAADSQPALDEAGVSLAHALRMSFRILTFIIAVLILLFLSRGVFRVQSDEKILILRFGRTDSTLVKDQGLHYAWPYPIDECRSVKIQPRMLEVNTFWSKVTEQAKEESAEKGKEKPEVVLGAEDAFMLTGDMNVLQARWNVTYQVRRDNESVIKYFVRVGDDQSEQGLVRGALQSAVVREIGRMKVFDAYPRGLDLPERVKATLSRTLEDMDCGLTVVQVSLIDIRPPKDVKSAFDEVLAAQQGAAQLKTEAERETRKMLIDAGGDVGIELGAEVEKWWDAKAANNAAETKACEARMSQLYKKAGGQSRTIIQEAESYRIAVSESAKADATQLTSLLQNSPREVKIFLDHARVDALQDVFNSCYEKFLYRVEDGKTKPTLELWMNRRPELLREARKIQETR